MGTSGNRDCKWASRSVLKDFTEDALTISAGSLLKKWESRNCEGELATRVQHRSWLNLEAWLRSPLRVGCAKVGAMGNSKRS